MCLLAIFYQTLPGAPLLVAANREEFFDRPFLPPQIHGRGTKYLAGVDVRAGGTWLGVNQHHLIAAVTNRAKTSLPERPRSRGLLCRDLLACATAQEAAELLRRELATGLYAGANFIVADPRQGVIVDAAEEPRFVPMTPGLHIVTNGPADDPLDARLGLAREMFAADKFSDVPTFLDTAQRVCRQGPDSQGRSIVLRWAERGTVSSTLLAVTDKASDAACAFAAGAPDLVPYIDYSSDLRRLLAGE